jgi:hypothetical protein
MVRKIVRPENAIEDTPVIHTGHTARLVRRRVSDAALCRCYGASGEGMAPSALFNGYRWSAPDVATLSF